MNLPLVEMTVADDFVVYEKFVSTHMKPEDFFAAEELSERLGTGAMSAWWVRNELGLPIAWCGMTHKDRDWEGACSFSGIVVHRDYRHTKLALRLIRYMLKQAGVRPMMTYIQPGGETERLLKCFGFCHVGVHPPWNVYRREQ